jgi:hypothetical protein
MGFRVGLPALMLALALVAPADTTPGRMIGAVTDTTGHPVAGAEVSIDSAQWHPVSEAGAFVFPRLSAGRHLLIVRSPGYAVDSLHFTIDAGESMALTAKLEKLSALSVVNVQARADTAMTTSAISHDWTEGFEYRKRHSNGGTFLDQEAIDGKGAMRMTELLRTVPGVQLVPVANDFGGNDFKIVMRGTATVQGESCPIQYYFDGHPFEESDDIDRLISPHQIAAMEIYSGSSQVPEQFKGPHARCGIIVIWTKSQGSR